MESKPSRLTFILTWIYVGLDAGYLACGAGVLLLTRIGWRLGSAREFVFLNASVLMALAALVPFARDLNSVIILLILTNFGAGCWIAMYLTMAQEVSREHVSTAAGLLGGTGSLAGAFAMWAVGAVSHSTSSFTAPLAAVAVERRPPHSQGWQLFEVPPVRTSLPIDGDAYFRRTYGDLKDVCHTLTAQIDLDVVEAGIARVERLHCAYAGSGALRHDRYFWVGHHG